MKTLVSNYNSLAELFFDESIRTEKIIWLAAQSDQPSRDFKEEFLESEDPGRIAKLLGVKKKLVSDLQSEDGAEEFISELARAGKMGFLVEASTPVPHDFHKDGGYTSYGFGHCQLCWFYTEAIDSAFVQKLLDWKQSVIACERKRQEKKAQRATP